MRSHFIPEVSLQGYVIVSPFCIQVYADAAGVSSPQARRLAEIYADALDASKSGAMPVIPKELQGPPLNISLSKPHIPVCTCAC